MKRNRETPPWIQISLAIVLGIAFLAGGCGRFEAPTAPAESSDANGDLWNPQPGDEIIAGQEVPLLDPGYWDNDSGIRVNPNDNAVNGMIGPEGGELMLGNHCLVVPAGAVDRDMVFTMAYASRTGVAVACTPSCTFNTPVLLTLSYLGTQYEDELDPSNLNIFYLPEHGLPVIEPSTVNLEEMSVTGSIDHFSRYTLG